jgi:hypothetical protein
MTWFAFTANQSDRVNCQDGIAIGYVQLVLDNKILNLAHNLQMWPNRYSATQCAYIDDCNMLRVCMQYDASTDI